SCTSRSTSGRAAPPSRPPRRSATREGRWPRACTISIFPFDCGRSPARRACVEAASVSCWKPRRPATDARRIWPRASPTQPRSRLEPGQGEAWVLIASPCGTDGETETDAGLTALFATAATDEARVSGDARVEPWVTADGVGILVHGPALASETPATHARRLAD